LGVFIFTKGEKMKIYETKKEKEGLGFKRLFPTDEYLLDQINNHPRTKEEAIKNRTINEFRKII